MTWRRILELEGQLREHAPGGDATRAGHHAQAVARVGHHAHTFMPSIPESDHVLASGDVQL
jgi:hypothetical protein